MKPFRIRGLICEGFYVPYVRVLAFLQDCIRGLSLHCKQNVHALAANFLVCNIKNKH